MSDSPTEPVLMPSPPRPQPAPAGRWWWRWVQLLAVLGLWVGAGSVLVLCAWGSVLLILRPQPPQWLARQLPIWVLAASDRPTQSLADITAALATQQRWPGDLIAVEQLGDDPQLVSLYLLPVWEQRSPCHRGCEAIVELRLYRLHRQTQDTRHLQLLDTVPIQGPPEDEVIASGLNAPSRTQGSTYPLPLQDWQPLYHSGLPGGWLTLKGRWQHQGNPVLYGQLFYIDAQRQRLSSLLNWQSLSGRLPAWYNLDGVGAPELVVNQSVGLEPRFAAYTVDRAPGAHTMTYLSEVALHAVTLPDQEAQPAYQQALFLAQNGLWSAAQQQLEPLRQQLAAQWPQAAERQWQLVRLHAQISQRHARQEWSQPSQKLLARLLDGQWQRALAELDQSDPRLQRVVLPLLERNASRLWRCLTASLQVEANQPTARLWGALLLLAKEDETTARQWLTREADDPLARQFDAIAAQLQASASSQVAEGASRHTLLSAQTDVLRQGLLGTARLLPSLTPEDWQLAPGAASLALAADQQWYAITIQAHQTPTGWQASASSQTALEDPNAPLWQSLGLMAGTSLQLLTLDGTDSHPVQIRAVRWQAGTLILLASGPPASTLGPWIACWSDQWHRPQLDQANSIGQLYQQQPQLGDRLLTTLSHHLGLDPTSLAFDFSQAATDGADFARVQRGGFRRDQDLLLILTPQGLAHSDLPITISSPIHLILSPQGELLYSDLWAGSRSTLVGWLQSAQEPAALVVTQGETVQLLPWSSRSRRFQPLVEGQVREDDTRGFVAAGAIAAEPRGD